MKDIFKPKSNHSGKLFVIDPGCESAFGHNYETNRLFHTYCSKQNIPTTILVSKNCASEAANNVSALPVLTPATYVDTGANPEEFHITLTTIRSQLLEEFKLHFQNVTAGDQMISHTTSHWHLTALVDWMEYAKIRDVKLYLVFRFPPLTTNRQDVADREMFRAFRAAYKDAFSRLDGMAIKYRVYADCHHTMEEIRGFFQGPVSEVPSPIGLPDEPMRLNEDLASLKSPLYVFPGAARREKGIVSLVDAMEMYVNEGRTGTFALQSLKGCPGETVERIHALGDRAHILEKSLHGQDFYNLLYSADCVILPYVREKYATRTSQILIETLAAGTPVIVTRDTWLDNFVSQLDVSCGLICDQSPEALFDAICEFETSPDQYKQEAKAISTSVRDRHNFSSFFSSVFVN